MHLIFTTILWLLTYWLIIISFYVRKLRFRLINLAQTTELTTDRARTPARICLTPKAVISNIMLWCHYDPNSVMVANCCPTTQYLILWGISDMPGQFSWNTVISIKIVLIYIYIWIQRSFFPPYSNANGIKRSQFTRPLVNNYSHSFHVYSILCFSNI